MLANLSETNGFDKSSCFSSILYVFHLWIYFVCRGERAICSLEGSETYCVDSIKYHLSMLRMLLVFLLCTCCCCWLNYVGYVGDIWAFDERYGMMYMFCV